MSQPREKTVLAFTDGWLKKNGVFRQSRPCAQIFFTGRKPLRLVYEGQVYLITPTLCFVVKPGAASVSFKADEKKIFLPSGDLLKSVRTGLIQVTPLMKELLNHTSELGHLKSGDKEHLSIYRLLSYQLVKSQQSLLRVPVPRDERAYKLYQLLVQEGHFDKNFSELAKISGASARTMERLLMADIGLNFSTWRQMMRIQKAILLLNDGLSVTDVATEVGYGSSSAFIHAFKTQLGLSPKQYLNQNK